MPKLDGEEEDEEGRETVEEAFGTLTIKKGGQAQFFGSLAGSEFLRAEANGDDPNPGLSTPPPTAGLDKPLHHGTSGDSFDFAGINRAEVSALRYRLPDWTTEGQYLAESYWENVNWM